MSPRMSDKLRVSDDVDDSLQARKVRNYDTRLFVRNMSIRNTRLNWAKIKKHLRNIAGIVVKPWVTISEDSHNKDLF